MTYLCAWWDRSGLHVLDYRDVLDLARQVRAMESRGLTPTTEPTDDQRRRIWERVQSYINADASEAVVRLQSEVRDLRRKLDAANELAAHYREMLIDRVDTP